MKRRGWQSRSDGAHRYLFLFNWLIWTPTLGCTHWVYWTAPDTWRLDWFKKKKKEKKRRDRCPEATRSCISNQWWIFTFIYDTVRFNRISNFMGNSDESSTHQNLCIELLKIMLQCFIMFQLDWAMLCGVEICAGIHQDYNTPNDSNDWPRNSNPIGSGKLMRCVFKKKKDNFFCFFFFIFCLHVSVSNVRHQHWTSSFFPFLSLSVCFHCFIFCLIFGLFCLVLSISPSFCGINQSTIVIQRVNRKRRRSWRSWRGGRFEPMSRTMSHSTSRCYQNGNLITSSAINFNL